jgi:uncharacterized protein YeaO (DUF488 family)
MDIRIKRAYDEPSSEDGKRFLVDRVWPRGIKKEDLDLDDWIKEAAPSAGLRKWFDHRADRWEGFCETYREELDQKRETLRPLYDAMKEGAVTLVYSARDEERNQAVVLRRYLSETR